MPVRACVCACEHAYDAMVLEVGVSVISPLAGTSSIMVQPSLAVPLGTIVVAKTASASLCLCCARGGGRGAATPRADPFGCPTPATACDHECDHERRRTLASGRRASLLPCSFCLAAALPRCRAPFLRSSACLPSLARPRRPLPGHAYLYISSPIVDAVGNAIRSGLERSREMP